jgi:membrane protease YdiL (CAAX protease family)
VGQTTPNLMEPPAAAQPAEPFDPTGSSPHQDGGSEPPILPAERVIAALEVLMCSGFPTQLVVIAVLTTLGMSVRTADGSLSSPFVFALTLIDTVLLIGLVLFFLRAHNESPRAVLAGWRPPARELLFGIVLIPVSFVVIIAALTIVQFVRPTLHNVPHNPLQDLVHTRVEAVIFALVVMIAGGVREEVQRGFVLHRFERYLGGGLTGLVLFSAVFGLGHLEQGYDIAIATGILGAFWGAIYLRRRSILGPMIGHAGFNLAQVAKFSVFGW